MKLITATIILINTSIFAQTVTNDTTICNGSSVWLVASGGNNYIWNTSDNTDSILVSPTNTETYYVTINDDLGNNYNDSVKVIIKQAPLSEFYYTISNDTVNFIANSDYTQYYNWSFGDDSTATGQNTYHIYNQASTFNVCLITSNDCIDTICKPVEINCYFPLNIFPVDTFVYPNQNFTYEIEDDFQSYLWSTGDTTNYITIIYDSLASVNNTISITIATDTACNITSNFNLQKYMCQAFNVYIDTANLNIQDNLITICKDETLLFSFSDTVNFYENNTYYNQQKDDLQYFWDFNDNTEIETGTNISHSFSNSGLFNIKAYAVDTFGCKSNNANPNLSVYIPYYNLNLSIAPDTIILGDTVNLFSNLALGTVNYTSLENTETLFIPDGEGIEFDSYISSGLSGVIDTNSNIIENICVNIEHSYLGDLQIELTCPYPVSKTIILHAFSNGSNTFLGEPIDDDSDFNPGIGYDYCWAQNPEYGTMADEAYAVISLPSGSYTSFESLDNLIGCPLNGLWKLTIIDNWSSDNGYLFNWSIEFDSLYYTSDITNIIWQGEAIDNPNADTTFAVPTSVGLHEYTYTVENEYGCSYDTTVYVYVDMADNIINKVNNIFTVYPNPANNQLTISNKNAIIEKAEILDITGKLIMQIDLANYTKTQTINISKLDKGVYFVRVNDNNLVKFVKE